MRDRAAGSPILKGAVYGAAAAGLSYLGIKHFSRAGLKGFYKTFERDLSHLIGLRRSRKASRFLSGKVDSARSALGLTGVDVLHHDLAEDLRTAERIFSARSGWTGNREAVIHGLLERWSGPGAHAGPLPDEIQRLTKMPVFRQVVERMGLSPDVVAARVASGGMGAKYRTIGELTRASVHAIRVPFLPFAVRPFELLTPTDLLSRGPGLGLLDPRNIAKEPNAIGALFSAGTLYPVHSLTVGKQTFRSIGRVAAGEGYHIGSARSGMGVGAMARMGITGARPLEDILEKYPHLGEPVKGGAVLGALKGLSPGNKMTRAALEIGERYGIGPQYSRVPLGGKLREIYEGFKRAATHKSIEYNLTDAQVWSEWPEISLLKRGLGKLRLSKKGAVQGAKDLSIAERMMLKLGIEPKRAVLKTGPLGEFIQKVPAARFKSTTGEFMSGLDRFTQRSPHSKYAFKSARQGLSDWFNYHLNRPSWLLNEMTGLGLRPGKTPLESLWKISTRVALPAYFGWQALQYAEYKSRKYFGYGPISGAAMVYTKGRLAAQHMLDATGITATAESLEERFPGLIDSPLAKAGVMVGAVATGGTLGRISAGAKGGAVGLAAGLTAGLLYATGITTPADKLREMYQGERDVPVRAGRGWALGRNPFAGGRIKYEKRHWFAEMMSNYRDKARYGSSREAWRGSWLPVPENWFTLKNIMDPYYISRLHHHDRPYPTTSALFQEAPIVGPMLSATIGRLMKPVVHRAPSASGVSPEVAAGQREAEAIGLGQAPIAAPRPVLKWRLDAMTANTIHNLFQWTGLPGFMVGAMKEQATGSPGFLAHQQILADTGEITSTVNSYYDRELGGGLGSTELLRRFIPKRRGHAMYNPLQNVAPSWLPGSRSVFPEDREGYIDFHSGDPFSRIAKGEARLPGPGYEALHQLHSGKPGVYDELERLKILADVAPASQAFKQYKQVVQSQINRGELSSMDAKQFHRAIDKMEERFESRVSTYGNRYRTGAFATGEMTVAGVMSPTTFTTREMPEMMFRLAGVKETDLASGGQAAGALNATMRGLIGQRVSMTWGGQGRVMPAIVEGVNRTAIEGGLERDRLSDLGYRAKHGSGFLEQAWEAVTHLQMPGPLDYPRVKWLGVRSPLEEYQQFQLHGTADTDWKHPVKNYLIPWAASTFRFQTPESSHAREASEYLDKFQYAKYRRLAVRAEDAGRMDMASEYRRRAGATAVALDINQPSFWSDVYRAMPRPERPYFKVFAGTTSEQERERIIESVPDYMRDIYMGVWKRSTPGNTFDSPVLSHYGEVARRASRISPDEKVAEFFASHPTPPKDYMAWHPGVDLESVTVKTAANEGINIHQLGLWESQALRSERMFPQLAPLDVRGRPDLDRRDELLNEMSRAGVNDLDWSPSQRDDGSMRVTLKKRRRGFLGSLFEPLEMAW